MTGRRAGQAATGYALRGMPRAGSTTTAGEPTTTNHVDLSTTRFHRSELPPLVNIRSARVVKIRSARTGRPRAAAWPAPFQTAASGPGARVGVPCAIRTSGKAGHGCWPCTVTWAERALLRRDLGLRRGMADTETPPLPGCRAATPRLGTVDRVPLLPRRSPHLRGA